MRILLLVLMVCAVTPAYAQQKNDLPRDGNRLLDSCSVVVDVADSSASLASLNNEQFTEKMSKFSWCVGYLQALQDAASMTQVRLAIIAAMGVTLEGPDKQRMASFEMLRGTCFPEKAPISQLARVLVKWLREHPFRLHEPVYLLTNDAFKETFPCAPVTPAKEAAKPPETKP